MRALYGLPWWLSGKKKKSAFQCKRHEFDPWVGKIPWRRKWQPSPVFLPGKFHGQRSLVGYSRWDCKESDMTEQLIYTFYLHSSRDTTIWYQTWGRKGLSTVEGWSRNSLWRATSSWGPVQGHWWKRRHNHRAAEDPVRELPRAVPALVQLLKVQTNISNMCRMLLLKDF